MTTSTRSSATSSNRGPEAGTGVIGTVTGVTVFVTLLLFAVQVLIGLHATTVVTAAAYDAAKSVAGADRPPPEVAVATARQRIGRWGERAVFVWAIDDETVSLTVRAPRPTLLPLVSPDVVRTVRVRVESVR